MVQAGYCLFILTLRRPQNRAGKTLSLKVSPELIKQLAMATSEVPSEGEKGDLATK